SDARFNSIKARLARMPPARTMKELEASKGSGTPTSSGGSTLPDKVPDQVEPPSRKLVWHRSASGVYEVVHPSNWSVVAERDASLTLAAPGGAWKSDGGADVRFGALF